MDKIKVLFFSADPLSAPPDGRTPRLLLDEDVRRIRQKVRAAEHRDALAFDFRLAARTDDLLQALHETRPEVVHFSGHGNTGGLVLVSADGQRAHLVPPEALVQLFEAFGGGIRLVVLNACFSQPQAKAIARVVGCAIGTRRAISDEAALTFGAAFYQAVAFGQSVHAAFEQARAVLALEHFEERDCPALEVRPGVDPGQLVLVSPGGADPGGRAAGGAAPPRKRRAGWGARQAGIAAAALVVSSGALLVGRELLDRDPAAGPPSPGIQRLADTLAPDTSGLSAQAADSPSYAMAPARGLASPAETSTTHGGPSGAAELGAAKNLYQARNYAAAFPLFARAAEAGNAEAMGFLGIMYLAGQGVAPWPDQAILWLRRAAEERDPRGMNALGVAYERGTGVDRSYRWARHWYEAAQEKGYAEAMRNLGSLYRQGLGVDQSHAQALAWYRRASSAGSLDAMIDAALMYEEGMGTAPDPAEALRRYRTAADAGSPRGMFSMGRIYQEGVGVARDYGEARSWYLKGAEAGSADAMNNLGVLYHHGWGVPRSRAEAIRWFRLAADAGSANAKGNLAALQAG